MSTSSEIRKRACNESRSFRRKGSSSPSSSSLANSSLCRSVRTVSSNRAELVELSNALKAFTHSPLLPTSPRADVLPEPSDSFLPPNQDAMPPPSPLPPADRARSELDCLASLLLPPRAEQPRLLWTPSAKLLSPRPLLKHRKLEVLLPTALGITVETSGNAAAATVAAAAAPAPGEREAMPPTCAVAAAASASWSKRNISRAESASLSCESETASASVRRRRPLRRASR
eukprot:scaffold154780_cov27-Tisochrysis_lutea.AAC.5